MGGCRAPVSVAHDLLSTYVRSTLGVRVMSNRVTGKGDRARPHGARGKVAAQRAAAKRAARRKRILLAGVGTWWVVLLRVVLAVVRPGLSAPSAATSSTGTAAQNAAVARQVTSVPAATFNAVGAGRAAGLNATSGRPPLTANGKPEVVYMGGEFCPYCAAERWALTAALGRFGTF